MTPDKDTPNQGVLEYPEVVRLRPGMYVGGTDDTGLYHCVDEVLDLAITYALADTCTYLAVTIHDDLAISVNDNSQTTLSKFDSVTGLPYFEILLTQLHSSRQEPGLFETRYLVAGGLHGIGLAAVNALCEQLHIEIRSQGKVQTATFKKGVVARSPHIVREMQAGEANGVRIRLKADPDIFVEAKLDAERVKQRLQQVAFLCPHLTIQLFDERVVAAELVILQARMGLSGYIAKLDSEHRPFHPILHSQRTMLCWRQDKDEQYEIKLDAALRFSERKDASVKIFVNTGEVENRGPVWKGFQWGLRRAVCQRSSLNRDQSQRFGLVETDDQLVGLTAVVSILHPDPRFEAAKGTILSNPELEYVIAEFIAHTICTNVTANRRYYFNQAVEYLLQSPKNKDVLTSTPS